MREEVVEKRGHLVTTEADLKLGTFLEKENGSGSGYVFDAYLEKGRMKRLGAIGDGRPAVGRKENEKKEDDSEEEEDDDKEEMKEAGPPTFGAPLTAPE